METWIKTGIGFFLMLFGAEIVVRQELKRQAVESTEESE